MIDLILPRGTLVRFRDENGAPAQGRIISYGQANDGTGRWGYSVETMDGRQVYWRPSSQIRE